MMFLKKTIEKYNPGTHQNIKMTNKNSNKIVIYNWMNMRKHIQDHCELLQKFYAV